MFGIERPGKIRKDRRRVPREFQIDSLTDLERRVVPATFGLDRWWAVAGQSQPIDVNWTVNVPDESEYVLDVDVSFENKWDLTSSAVLEVYKPELSETFPLRTFAFDFQGDAFTGRLTPGDYRFRIRSFEVPDEPVVEGVKFQLYKQVIDIVAPFATRELEALFVADLPQQQLPAGFKVIDTQSNFSKYYAESPTKSRIQQLVEDYAPILHFQNLERYSVPAIVDTTLTPLPPVTGDKSKYVNLAGLSSVSTIAPDANYSEKNTPSAIYASLNVDNSRVAITYWFYYYNSNWGEHGGHNNHYGDWESAAVFFEPRVRLTSSGTFEVTHWEPVSVAVSQHIKLTDWGAPIGGQAEDWSDIEAIGTHPSLYVGLGGHATYFESGDTTWLVPNLPNALRTEIHRGNGKSYYPSDVIYLNRVGGDLPVPDWQRFPGKWGQEVKNSIGITVIGPGPRGPVFQNPYVGSFISETDGEKWLRPWFWASGFEQDDIDARRQPTDAFFQGKMSEAEDDLVQNRKAWLWHYEKDSWLERTYPENGDTVHLVGGSDAPSLQTIVYNTLGRQIAGIDLDRGGEYFGTLRMRNRSYDIVPYQSTTSMKLTRSLIAEGAFEQRLGVGLQFLTPSPTIYVDQGSRLTLDGTLQMPRDARLQINGPGETIVRDSMLFGNSVLQVNGGTLRYDDAEITANMLYSLPDVTLASNSTLRGSGRIANVIVGPNVDIRPGSGINGVLSLENNLSLASDTDLMIEIGEMAIGFTAQRYNGRLQFSSDAITLNGANLKVNFGYVPAVGQRFTIIDTNRVNGVVGTFAQGSSISINAGISMVTMSILYNTTLTRDEVQLVVTSVNNPSRFKDRTITPGIFEGGIVEVAGTIVDDDKGDVFFLDVDWGDGTRKTFTFRDRSGERVVLKHRYVDNGTKEPNPGQFVVKLTWRDRQGAGNSVGMATTVLNAAPAIRLDGVSTQPNGTTIHRFTVSDAGREPVNVRMDYSDGSTRLAYVPRGNRRFVVRSNGGRAGILSGVTATDKDGATGSMSFAPIVPQQRRRFAGSRVI